MKRPLCCLAFILLAITGSYHFLGIFPSTVISVLLCGVFLHPSFFKKELKLLFLSFIVLISIICVLRFNKTKQATKLLTDNVVDVNITVYEAEEKAKTSKITAKGIIAFKEKKYKFGETKLYLKGNGFKAGDTISFKATVKPKKSEGLNFEPEFLNIFNVKEGSGNCFEVYGFFGRMREVLSNEALNITYGKETRLFPALLTGNKKYLTFSQQKILNNGGISHLTAVSGMHLAVLIGFLSVFLKKQNVKTRFFIKMAACLFTAGISGFSPSIMRAWAMLLIYNLGELFGRKSDTVTSLGAFSVVMCMFFPHWLFRLGTWLSVFAVLGITLFSDRLVSFFKAVFKFKSDGVWEKLFQLISISVSANLATLPIISISFGYFPFWSVMSNILLMGIVAIMLAVLWFSVMLSLIFNIRIEFLSRFLAMGARMILKVAEFFGNLPPKFIGVDENYIKLFLIVAVTTLLFLSASGVYGKRLLISALMLLSCCFFMVSVNTLLNFDKAKVVITDEGCGLIVKGQRAVMLGNVGDSFKAYQLQNALKRLNVHKIEAVILDGDDILDLNLYHLMSEFDCDTVLGEGVSYRAFCKWGNFKEYKLKENTIYPLGIRCEHGENKITFFFKGGSLLKSMGKCDIITEDCTVRELQDGIFCTKFCIGEQNDNN